MLLRMRSTQPRRPARPFSGTVLYNYVDANFSYIMHAG